ncbi:hypothetical protein SLA2020_185730 [Shorea laevis]
MLKYQSDERCQSNGFYMDDAFIAAAQSFNGFGTTGDINTRKRELAAFLAQTSHETSGGWSTAPDGSYARGYCFIRERNDPPAYCSSSEWPCPPGKQYCGRGSIQLTRNYNYGQAIKPQCNYRTIWTPSDADISAGRVPAYGVFTNIINGAVERGHGQDDEVDNRIGY